MSIDHQHSSDFLNRMLSEISPADRSELKDAWELAGDARPVDPAVRSRVWAAVEAHVGATSRPRPVLRLVSADAWYRYAAVAASIVVFVVAGLLSHPEASLYKADTSAAQVGLVDGTVVDLAPGSVLRLEDSFGHGTRKVSLDGEAYFDVSSATENDGASFVVGTFNASVEVLGTAFNVRARPSEPLAATRVAVAHGLVSVASDSPEHASVVVQPGQSTTVVPEAGPINPRAADVNRIASWRDGAIVFDGIAMGAAFEELQRRYGIDIQAPEAIRRLKVSYWHETAASPDVILADLVAAVDAEFRKTASGFEVYQPE